MAKAPAGSYVKQWTPFRDSGVISPTAWERKAVKGGIESYFRTEFLEKQV